MSETDWKKFLLKSGLPFEYEVKEIFVNGGCTVWDEYAYMREDENKIEKEFSFDQHANWWLGGNSVDFMIECKYKTEPAKWFFTPDPYAYQDDLSRNDFMHPVDHFIENIFLYDRSGYEKVLPQLGSFCLKGVEIFNKEFLETNIYKAINQLCYAFMDYYLNAIENQLSDGPYKDVRYFLVPIIVTNAELHVINQNITTQTIKTANSIEEISTRQDFLLYHVKPGGNLRGHNYDKLMDFFNTPMAEKFNARNQSFAKDISHFVNHLSTYPRSILIMHHDEKHENYKKLFNYIQFLVTPSKQLTEKTKYVQSKYKAILGKLKPPSVK